MIVYLTFNDAGVETNSPKKLHGLFTLVRTILMSTVAHKVRLIIEAILILKYY